jgi:cytochrome bd-type quinol oxidase subunit 2
MSAAFLFKIVIVALLVVILVSLTTSLFFVLTDRGQTTRAAKSLTWRVALSVLLFVLLIIGFATGLIQPHGLPQAG